MLPQGRLWNGRRPVREAEAPSRTRRPHPPALPLPPCCRPVPAPTTAPLERRAARERKADPHTLLCRALGALCAHELGTASLDLPLLHSGVEAAGPSQDDCLAATSTELHGAGAAAVATPSSAPPPRPRSVTPPDVVGVIPDGEVTSPKNVFITFAKPGARGSRPPVAHEHPTSPLPAPSHCPLIAQPTGDEARQ